jgi:hypothetical protein
MRKKSISKINLWVYCTIAKKAPITW